MAETLWQGRPARKIRWEFPDPREPMFYMMLIGLALLSVSLGWWLVAFFTVPLAVALVLVMIFRHPWRAFQRRSHRYSLMPTEAIIRRTNLLGMPITETYPITPDMEIKLVEGDGLHDVYFGRRLVSDTRSDSGTRHRIFQRAGFELIPDGREVYLRMLELQLERVKNAGA